MNLNGLWLDLSHAARSLRQSRAVTAAALASLALGIGANVAIFSVVDDVLLERLPYREPDRLVRIWESFVHPSGIGRGSVSPPNFRDWQAQASSFEAIGTYNHHIPANVILGDGAPAQAAATRVSSEILPLLGVEPVLGRWFAPEDDDGETARAVILSDRFWAEQHDRDPEVVGTTLRIDGTPMTVVGVMPPTFDFPPRSETLLWLPLVYPSSVAESRGSHWLASVARLAPGVDLDGARAELSAIAARIEQQYPDSQTDRGVLLEDLSEAVVGSDRGPLLTLFGIVGLVLLIGCVNVANLLLARASARRKEIAVRTALGAGRSELVRRVLAESFLLALAGGGLGYLLGRLTLVQLSRLPGSPLPIHGDAGSGVSGLAFCLAASLVATLASGLPVALRTSRLDPQRVIQKEASGRLGASRDPVRTALVVAEIAVAVIVLVGASLMLRSFHLLSEVETGIAETQVLSLRVPLSPFSYDTPEARTEFFDRLLPEVRALPGVEAAGLINVLPLQNWGWNTSFSIEGRAVEAGERQPFAESRRISSGYFAAMGIPVLEGRDFTPSDGLPETPPRWIVNRALAKTYFPGESAVGKRAGFGSGAMATIIGVVENVRNVGLHREPLPELYAPYRSAPDQAVSLTVRSSIDPESMGVAVTGLVRAIDPEQPVALVQTMDRVLDRHLADRRFKTLLFSIFGGLALVLTMVGVYGLVAFAVAQRTGEIGLRMALGAQRTRVLSMVLRQGVGLALVGSVPGALVALGLGRLLESQLYGVRPTDPTTFLLVLAGLVGITAAAAALPARRAASVDPVTALRGQ